MGVAGLFSLTLPFLVLPALGRVRVLCSSQVLLSTGRSLEYIKVDAPKTNNAIKSLVSHAMIKKNPNVCLSVSLSVKSNMGLDDKCGKSRAWKFPESFLLPRLSLGLLLGRFAVGLFSHAQDVKGKSCKVMEVM